MLAPATSRRAETRTSSPRGRSKRAQAATMGRSATPKAAIQSGRDSHQAALLGIGSSPTPPRAMDTPSASSMAVMCQR